jgi:hypothetical protein
VTPEIECVVPPLPEVVARLDATLPVSEWAKNHVKQYNYPASSTSTWKFIRSPASSPANGPQYHENRFCSR